MAEIRRIVDLYDLYGSYKRVAFVAASPRAGLPLPDPAKVSADRDRSVA